MRPMQNNAELLKYKKSIYSSITENFNETLLITEDRNQSTGVGVLYRVIKDLGTDNSEKEAAERMSSDLEELCVELSIQYNVADWLPPKQEKTLETVTQALEAKLALINLDGLIRWCTGETSNFLLPPMRSLFLKVATEIRKKIKLPKEELQKELRLDSEFTKNINNVLLLLGISTDIKKLNSKELNTLVLKTSETTSLPTPEALSDQFLKIFSALCEKIPSGSEYKAHLEKNVSAIEEAYKKEKEEAENIIAHYQEELRKISTEDPNYQTFVEEIEYRHFRPAKSRLLINNENRAKKYYQLFSETYKEIFNKDVDFCLVRDLVFFMGKHVANKLIVQLNSGRYKNIIGKFDHIEESFEYSASQFIALLAQREVRQKIYPRFQEIWPVLKERALLPEEVAQLTPFVINGQLRKYYYIIAELEFLNPAFQTTKTKNIFIEAIAALDRILENPNFPITEKSVLNDFRQSLMKKVSEKSEHEILEYLSSETEEGGFLLVSLLSALRPDLNLEILSQDSKIDLDALSCLVDDIASVCFSKKNPEDWEKIMKKAQTSLPGYNRRDETLSSKIRLKTHAKIDHVERKQVGNKEDEENRIQSSQQTWVVGKKTLKAEGEMERELKEKFEAAFPILLQGNRIVFNTRIEGIKDWARENGERSTVLNDFLKNNSENFEKLKKLLEPAVDKAIRKFADMDTIREGAVYITKEIYQNTFGEDLKGEIALKQSFYDAADDTLPVKTTVTDPEGEYIDSANEGAKEFQTF